MRFLLAFFILSQLSAFAGIQKINIQNLDLEYAAPYGKGTLDKFGVGTTLAPEALDVEIYLTERTLDITSTYVDFTWNDPQKFIYQLDQVSARKTTIVLGHEKHNVESEDLIFSLKEKGEYQVHQLKGSCDGGTSGSFKARIFEDCKKKMDLTIKKLDISSKSILNKIVEDLPLASLVAEEPADNVIFTSRDGKIFLQAYLKIWFYAGLRFYGHMEYENDYKVLVLRVDQIKFGHLPITRFVMKKLQELNSESINVDPPWIRLTLEK